MYGNSEERIGRAIAGRREGLILATKSHAREGPELRQHLELSLKQLRADYIDLYQLHCVSNFEDYEKSLARGGPLDVVREAQAVGQVGHIGITCHSMEVALEATKSGFFETMMFPSNFISNEATEKLIPLAQEHDVGFIIMKPMGGGLLENATIAFKYLRRFPDTVPIVGIEKAEEIEEIVAIMEGDPQMTPAEEAEMERLRAQLGTRFCRRCGYCQPCGGRTHPDDHDPRNHDETFCCRKLLPQVGDRDCAPGRELRPVRRVRGKVPLSPAHPGDDGRALGPLPFCLPAARHGQFTEVALSQPPLRYAMQQLRLVLVEDRE